MAKLQNRFPENLKYEWQFWYSCMVCGQNSFDALHHTISPPCRVYIKGEHNKSILNSCPICNFKCHIGNESYLHKIIPSLLVKVKNALLDDLGYKLKPVDKDFLEVYKNLYENELKNYQKNSQTNK